jgi:hypothetical protein
MFFLGFGALRMAGRGIRGVGRMARGGSGSNAEPARRRLGGSGRVVWGVAAVALWALLSHKATLPPPVIILVVAGAFTLYGIPVAIAHRGRPSEKQEKEQMVKDFRAFRENLARKDKAP